MTNNEQSESPEPMAIVAAVETQLRLRGWMLDLKAGVDAGKQFHSVAKSILKRDQGLGLDLPQSVPALFAIFQDWERLGQSNDAFDPLSRPVIDGQKIRGLFALVSQSKVVTSVDAAAWYLVDSGAVEGVTHVAVLASLGATFRETFHEFFTAQRRLRDASMAIENLITGGRQ